MREANSIVHTWATAISLHASNGRKIFWRYAKDFRSDFSRPSHSIRIILVWKYPSENGQPESAEHVRMNEMEDALESVLSQDIAILALVSTGENLREWTYYARAEQDFMARLNFALLDTPPFPIEIHIAHDPDWQMYQDFKNGIKD